MKLRNQDKSWAPHYSCGTCRSTLEAWFRGERRKMPFAIPRIWREPKDHISDCFFCLVNVSNIRRAKDRNKIVYPNVPSSTAPVSHSDTFPVPIPPKSSKSVSSESSSSSESEVIENFEEDPVFENAELGHPYFPNQDDLDDLVRDLNLTKSGAELLASRLKQWNLLQPTCKTTRYRSRNATLSTFYITEENLCYCHDIVGLFEEIKFEYNPKDWRLFIDSSSLSLKAVLLHNGNKFPSIPLAHSVQMKEDYSNVKSVLDKLKYAEHEWYVIGDFKMICFLLGLQGGFTKFSCFICLWDSRAKSQHYLRKDWPLRDVLVPGQFNVINEPLVKREKVLLPPLHIKLGLVKQYIKALNKEGQTFLFLKQFFPKISDAKLAGGILVGPQIKKLLECEAFEQSMNSIEKSAWQAFRLVVIGFLGNHRSVDHINLINNLLNTFQALGSNMSIKMHFLHSHLSFFKDNLGAFSEEHGERFHQDIKAMERRYQGHWDASMMGDYVWNLLRSTSTINSRKSRCATKHL
jgi:hypothetical protein